MQIEKGKKEVIEYSYKCDVCGKEPISYKRVCSICGRDICSDCTKFDPRDIGDYSARFCIACFNIGKKYLQQIEMEQEKFDKLVEVVEEEWKNEAIESIKTGNTSG